MRIVQQSKRSRNYLQRMVEDIEFLNRVLAREHLPSFWAWAFYGREPHALNGYLYSVFTLAPGGLWLLGLFLVVRIANTST